MRMRRGFTLVELSIVLVIIGLLIGGVLKGRAMIDNTKQKRVKSDIDGMVAATYSYQDKFGFLPGDDPTSIAGAPLSVAGCTGGDGDGLFDTNEGACVWRAIIAADFVSGDSTQTAENLVAKRSPYGGQYLFRNTGGDNNIQVLNMPNEVIQDLDRKYDDGVWNTGEVRSSRAYTTTTAQTLIWRAF